MERLSAWLSWYKPPGKAKVALTRRVWGEGLPSGAKTVQSPDVLGFIVTQNVIIAVACAHSEIACGRGVPAAVELVDFELAAAESKPERAFIDAITRIAFDAHFIHGASARRKVSAREAKPLLPILAVLTDREG
jgi:hypothetical protein